MAQYEVPDPILNSPFAEPAEHGYIQEGEEPERREGRLLWNPPAGRQARSPRPVPIIGRRAAMPTPSGRKGRRPLTAEKAVAAPPRWAHNEAAEGRAERDDDR